MNARQRRALEAICETFCPGACAAGVPETFLGLVPSADRPLLRRLLGLWDLPFVHGRRRRFTALPAAGREDVLRSWRDSRLTAKRQAFQGLRKGATIAYYGTVGIPGYPGARGQPAELRPRRITPTAPAPRLDCDVCIVGSGAGGGVAAAVLAAAGLDVVVLEAGSHYEDADFEGDELAAYQRLYLDAAALTTDDGGVGLLAGRCLGGTTMINYTTSFRTPDSVCAEWGAPFDSDDYSRSLDAVCERLGVGTDENRPSTRDEIMSRGLRALGWHVDAMPRNVRGCDQGRICGYCGFGCPLGAKQSTLVTWLEDAQRDGARILVETRAERILTEDGAAAGVEAVTSGGDRVTVQARAVALAAGALHTPVLLRRSGLGNEHVGRHLHVHPATGVTGLFAEEVRPWEGTLQALYSDEHSDLDGAGYGLKYETAPVHPGLLAAFSAWPGAAEHAELMALLPGVAGIGILLRDRSEGEVRPRRDGSPRVRYRLGATDVAHVRTGVDGAAQILEAAGAERIFSSHQRLVSYEPDRSTRADFVRFADAVGYGPGQCVFYGFHLMSSARMGASAATAACDPEGGLYGAGNVIVVDGSAFPSASGVNPMVTIEAIAHMNASALAARLA
jgi:choline dehydrogenase-like flavoprotein